MSKMGSKYILETKGLNVGYGPIHVIYDLDFKVPDGEVTIIVGPNGVGKTTLLKALMGLATVYSGEVHFEGKNISKCPTISRGPKLVSDTCPRQETYSATYALMKT